MLAKCCLAFLLTALPASLAAAADDFGGGLPFGTDLAAARQLLKDIPTESQEVMGFVTIEQAYSVDGDSGTLMYFFSPQGRLHKKTFTLSPDAGDDQSCREQTIRIGRRIAIKYDNGNLPEPADKEMFLSEYVFRLDGGRWITVHYTFGKPTDGCSIYVMYDDDNYAPAPR